MEKKRISREELKEDGWESVLTQDFTIKLFMKRRERILWDSKSQAVLKKWKMKR